VSVLEAETTLYFSCGMNLLNLEDFRYLGCDTVWSGRRVLAFHRNLLPPPSVQMIPMIKAAYTIYQITRRQALEKRRICSHFFYVFLTLHLITVFVNNQLDA